MSGLGFIPSRMQKETKSEQERERERISSLFADPQTMQSEVTQTDLSYFDLNTRYRNLEEDKETAEKKKTYLETKESIEALWHQKTTEKVKTLKGQGSNKNESYYASFTLKELEVLLKNNDRGGNSEQYNDVVTDLELYNSVTVRDDYSTYPLLSRLLESCNKYTKKRKHPWTTKGKIRKAIVSQLGKKIASEKEECHKRIFDVVDQSWQTFTTDKSMESVNKACKEHFELISASLQGKIELDVATRSKYDTQMYAILKEIENQPVDEEQNQTNTTRLFNALGWTSRKPRIADEDEFNQTVKRSVIPKKLFHTIQAPKNQPENGIEMGKQLTGISDTRHYMSDGIYGKGTYMTMRGKGTKPADDKASSDHCWTYGTTEGSVQFTLALNDKARVIASDRLDSLAQDTIGVQFPQLYNWIHDSEPMKVGKLIGKHWMSSYAAFLGYNVVTGMGTLMGEPPIDYFVACDRSALTILNEMQRRVSTKKPETTKVKLR